MEKILRIPRWGVDGISRLGPMFIIGPDLTDKRWIVAKGILFLVLAALSGVLQLVGDGPLWQKTLLLLICVWASCRFYYFLFHVLGAYLDPGLRSAGLIDLLQRLRRR